jgi:hypothetical protein
MKKHLEHNIDWEVTANGLGISIESVIKFFDDGRIIGRFGEFVDSEHTNSSRQNENSSFDTLTIENIRREIRSSRNNVSFAASKEVGSGRKVTEEGYKEKLNNVDEFVVIDSRRINQGKLVFYSLTTDEVCSLPLGKNKSMSSDKFWGFVEK